MRYQGGKFRIASQIAKVIRSMYPDASEIWEPFCGGGASSVGLLREGFKVHISDHHEDLILMYQALFNGSDEEVRSLLAPVGFEEYEMQRAAPASARRGFVGYGASFGGRWFRGLALNESTRSKGYINRKTAEIQPYDESRRSLLSLRKLGIGRVQVSLRDYREIPTRGLAYCDKPYADTTDYRGERFDQDAFWRWVELRQGPTFLSECSSGDSLQLGALEVVWRKSLSVTRRTTGPIRREERLYYMPPHDQRD